MRLQCRIVRHQVLKIAMKEAIFPHIPEDALKIGDLVRIGQGPVLWRHEQLERGLLVAAEQLEDDLVLVAEVVVEVARADAEGFGDAPRRNY